MIIRLRLYRRTTDGTLTESMPKPPSKYTCEKQFRYTGEHNGKKGTWHLQETVLPYYAESYWNQLQWYI